MSRITYDPNTIERFRWAHGEDRALAILLDQDPPTDADVDGVAQDRR